MGEEIQVCTVSHYPQPPRPHIYGEFMKPLKSFAIRIPVQVGTGKKENFQNN